LGENCINLITNKFLLFTEDTNLNNNNNNNSSLNNNTLEYSDKSTQTLAECCTSQKSSVKDQQLITSETQTDFTNLNSESILSSIPYADMTNSPPPPPPVPYRRYKDNKTGENCKDSSRNEISNEFNQLSARNLQHKIDTNIGVNSQSAVDAVSSDNGVVKHTVESNEDGTCL